MDSDSADNPWGAPSPSPAATPAVDAPSSPPPAPTSPRLSFDPDAEERPAWGTDDEQGERKEDKQEQEDDNADKDGEVTEPAHDDDDEMEEQEPVKDDETAPLEQNEDPEQAKEPPPADVKDEADAPPSPPSPPPEPAQPDDEPEPVDDTTPSSAVPALSMSLPDSTNDGPPTDDFSDDDGFGSPSFPSGAAGNGAAEAEDDFDDFGEAAGAGEGGEADDDFGDFGDFGDAAPLDESAFEAPALPPPVPVVAPSTPAPPAPTSAYPPFRLDLRNTARRAVAPQLKEFCAAVWSEAARSVSDEPERQVEGVGQVLVSESSRNLLANLSTLPPLRPLDWRRSKIRREHLVSMGIPVNLDDSNEPKYPSLGIPRTRLSNMGGISPTRSSSAPPLTPSNGAYPSGAPGSAPGSRSSTPFADRERSRPAAGPPPLDRARAEELLGVREEDLTLMSLERLRAISDEIERFSVEASGVLTHALMLREKEGQDKEVYNGMISDLVVAAAKMKTSSAAGARPPVKRQGSGRWGRS
ncbi:hypothetical protein JCM8097_003088 [Rhodosporidiobolus ruineniae]